MSLEVDVKEFLVTSGAGNFEVSSGWNICIGKMPSTPDTSICITRSGGLPPNPKWLLDYLNFQIRVRGGKGNYEEALSKIQEIRDLLLGVPSQDAASGDRWVSFTLQSDIVFLGYDENERPDFSVNFQTITEPVASAGSNRVAL